MLIIFNGLLEQERIKSGFGQRFVFGQTRPVSQPIKKKEQTIKLLYRPLAIEMMLVILLVIATLLSVNAFAPQSRAIQNGIKRISME